MVKRIGNLTLLLNCLFVFNHFTAVKSCQPDEFECITNKSTCIMSTPSLKAQCTTPDFCPEGMIRCVDVNCTKGAKCDGLRDCLDGSDENDCYKSARISQLTLYAELSSTLYLLTGQKSSLVYSTLFTEIPNSYTQSFEETASNSYTLKSVPTSAESYTLTFVQTLFDSYTLTSVQAVSNLNSLASVLKPSNLFTLTTVSTPSSSYTVASVDTELDTNKMTIVPTQSDSYTWSYGSNGNIHNDICADPI